MVASQLFLLTSLVSKKDNKAPPQSESYVEIKEKVLSK